MNDIKVLVLSTSFPLNKSSVSGLFVKRLVDNYPSSIQALVLVPCDTSNAISNDQFRYKVSCFKYAPKGFQILAHQSGGIPAALESNKCSLLLIPLFVVSMFVKCFIEARHVDLIHANWAICGVIGGIVGKIYSKPTITTIRGEDGNKAETNIIFRVLLKTAIFFSSYIVGVSDNLVKKVELISKNSGPKFICVPNGVDRNLIRYCQHIRPDTNKQLTLITVGNLTKNKNTALIFEAVRKIVEQGKKVTFNVVGDGPQKAELNNLIDKYRLSKNVYMWGNLPADKVYKLISKSNIFVLSSFREGRPNVLLESMAIGTPIVASNIESVKELIKHEYSGLLFNPYKCKELMECINRISDDKKLQRYLPKNALNHITSNELFWDESANKYVDLYNSALKQ